jgi:hypothetical protein
MKSDHRYFEGDSILTFNVVTLDPTVAAGERRLMAPHGKGMVKFDLVSVWWVTKLRLRRAAFSVRLQNWVGGQNTQMCLHGGSIAMT